MSDITPPLALTELLDVTYLQQLQDGFAAATNVTTAIIDPEGNRVTRPSNWRGICALCHDSVPCSPACREKTRILVEKSRESGQPVISDCPHGDFITAAVPIIVDNVFLGSWIFGQLVIKEPSFESIERTAGALGVSQESIGMTVNELPRYSTDVFNSLFSIIQTITASIVELGRKNKEMAKRDEELQKLTQQLETRDLVLTQYIQNSADAMYVCGLATGEVLIANQALCRLIGKSMDEVVGRIGRELLGETIQGFCAQCPRQNLLNENNEPTGTHSREFFFYKRGVWLRINHQAIAWRPDCWAHMVTMEDITQEHAMRERLEELAFYDNVTGLPNNNKLAMDFREDLDLHGGPNSFMVCLDLSSLRFFNDAYGKEVGNEMLKTILAWFQKEEFGKSRIFCMDSYEFCLLPEKGRDMAYAEAAARTIRDRFEKPWQVAIDGREISYVCTIFVSILHIPADTRRFEDLQNLISRTLNSGRKTSTGLYIYDEEMDRQNHEHIKLVLSLKESIVRGMEGFSVHYQPIVKLTTGLWSGVEALCRWTRPGHGPVSPLVFIREAETLGLINELGIWVLDTAVRQTKELGLDAVDEFFLSVNISPIQMMDASFADSVAAILEKHGFPGGKLNLEVTESAQMTFSTFTMDMIARLRSLGIRLALDDFGTGYSSFSNLKNLPVAFLKTEREFILGIENDSYMQYFFYIMSEIAHAAKMKFIAEGIETAEQVKIAKNNGADYIQGYFFSKPLPVNDLKEKYERFIVPDNSYIPATAEVVDIQHWLSGKSAYELTPALFNLMNRCMLILLSEKEVSSAIQSIFELVGDHFGVSRVFAFVQDDGPKVYSNLYEWCNDKVSSQKHLLQHVPMGLTPSLFKAFKENGMVIAGTLKDLAVDMQEALQGQDVMAVALIPMWDDAELLGFVGYDKTTAHAWSPEEIVMLWNLAILMANTIKREKLKLEVVEKKGILDTVLQRSGINAYVADIHDHELLWINESLRRGWSLPSDIVGKKCHEVLWNSSEPCSFCKIPELLDAPEGELIAHEVHSSSTERDYMAYGSLVQWSGRDKAFIHYSMDVTDQKTTEKQLEYLASTDMLTGAFNRATVINKMQELLQMAQETDTPLSVCYLDINRLKRINTHYGNDIGDQALFHTVQAIRSATQRHDIIGRMLSDDFIVLMPGCAKGLAKIRMLQARNTLMQTKLLPEPECISFSFGITDNSELDYEESSSYYSQLLSLAERKMREQKQMEEELAVG